MAAKKRCQFQIGTDAQCSSAALRIVGECPHCRAQFCSSVGLHIPPPFPSVLILPFPTSTGFQSTIIAVSWKTADNRHSTETSANWRASGLWLLRWPLHSVCHPFPLCSRIGGLIRAPPTTHMSHISYLLTVPPSLSSISFPVVVYIACGILLFWARTSISFSLLHLLVYLLLHYNLHPLAAYGST